MQNKFEPWDDIRLKSNSIRPFMSELDNAKWKLFFALDSVGAPQLKGFSSKLAHLIKIT